jgi:xylulokinase
LRHDVAQRLGLTEQTLVTVGGGDEHVAALGAGVLRPGLVMDIAGTAEAVGLASKDLAFDPSRLVESHCHAHPDLWFIEHPGFVSGANYRWFRDHFAPMEVAAELDHRGDAYELLDEAAARIPPGADGLLMLPCLMGAATPTWNATARGTFLGFTLAHSRGHFVRALLEASAYAVRDIIDQMRSMGCDLTEMRVVGGGARSRLWRQIKADVVGLPVVSLQTSETTSLGAAMIALVGTGAFSSLEEAADAMVKIDERLEPDPSHQAVYEESYASYREAYFALLPVFERSASFRRGTA